jgi:hypothetical protein
MSVPEESCTSTDSERTSRALKTRLNSNANPDAYVIVLHIVNIWLKVYRQQP